MIYTQESVIRRIGEHAPTKTPTDDVGRERLLAILQDQSTVAMESPTLFRFLSYFDFTFRYSGMDLDERHAYDAAMQALSVNAVEIFREGQSDGSISIDLDPQLTVEAMSGALIGLVQRYLAITSSEPSHSALELVQLEVSAWRAFLR